ncbi:unnamed protein product [Rotaria sordida]|uniref:TOD1/MUCI70 glycosyltransferase-like domain-containing protein n=1 Tax=Rotaria sordida TaxID=392033 RepID=A0A819I936_9BILA|nr:unnamed protein product [Rotaria sordida]CAF3912680.1 unnamed protein product [Rotaria sordida]
MSSTISIHYIVAGLILIIFCLFINTRFNYHHLPLSVRETNFNPCFEWDPVDHRLPTAHKCSKLISSVLWSYDGTGLMKYIQWIIVRKLGNIKITRLNDNCQIIQQNYFSSNSTNNSFVQIYIMSLSTNLNSESQCSNKINQIVKIGIGHINQIYFKRKSIRATVFFQQLDLIGPNINFTFDLNISFKDTINYFPNYFKSIKLTIINSEDLIKTNLTECEKILIDFISLLKLSNSSLKLNDIIEYDSHQFIEDSTWWDQSIVAENVLDMSIPSPSINFTYTNDFYHLHGNSSFIQYLYDNRQCYSAGIFAQMQFETIPNRNSTERLNRCLSKTYDCAFSDIYSFEDREQFYQQSYPKPIKCGFTISSIFDKVRNRYARNHTCETILFTIITDCYDLLPQIRGTLLPSFCFVALVDTKTLDAYKKSNLISPVIPWDLIDLGVNATPFSVAAKTTEILKTIGQRLFPLAKWIIWLDGRGQITEISQLLKQARAPVLGAPHALPSRTSASEVAPTIERVFGRGPPGSPIVTDSIADIQLQEKQYKQEGFYCRSDALDLRMFDIAVFLYRNNHPCIFRYSCGWHNEISYYSYRGQLSVYYPAVRFNLSDYLHFIPHGYFFIFPHRSVC